jgi:hypothetical protein
MFVTVSPKSAKASKYNTNTSKAKRERLIMKKVLATALLLVSFNSYGQEDHSEFCRGAVTYARNGMPTEDLTEVLNGQYKILNSTERNDMEKYVGLTLYIAFQVAAYNWDAVMEKYNDDPDAYFAQSYKNCMKTMKRYNFHYTGPDTETTIDSTGEIW